MGSILSIKSSPASSSCSSTKFLNLTSKIEHTVAILLMTPLVAVLLSLPRDEATAVLASSTISSSSMPLALATAPDSGGDYNFFLFISIVCEQVGSLFLETEHFVRSLSSSHRATENSGDQLV